MSEHDEQAKQCASLGLLGTALGVIFGAIVGPFLVGSLCMLVVLWLHVGAG